MRLQTNNKGMAYDQLKLDAQICFRLYTASRLVQQCYKPWFEKMGITYPQYLVLMVLWEHDNRVVSDITEQIQLETNTVTPLLQRMEREGLIIRTASAVDSRQKIVSLTKKGRQLEEQAKEIPGCLVSEMAQEGLDVSELEGMAPMLDKLIGVMNEMKSKK